MELDARTVSSSRGVSDRHAIEALAERQGRDLEAEGVAVVAMGGAQAIGRFLELYGPRGQGSSWPVSATCRRRTSSGAASSEPASGRT